MAKYYGNPDTQNACKVDYEYVTGDRVTLVNKFGLKTTYEVDYLTAVGYRPYQTKPSYFDKSVL